jgi:hypothetical protein
VFERETVRVLRTLKYISLSNVLSARPPIRMFRVDNPFAVAWSS